jgi:hypothetical protein
MMNIAFHIGYHKTATTWLQNVYFRSHPQIRLLSNSSQPWNDRFLRGLIASSDRNYSVSQCRNILEEIVSGREKDMTSLFLFSAERLSGHPFSGGFDSFRIAERIKACCPDAKILCVIRSQIDMIASVYKLLIEEGYTGKIESLFSGRHWKTVGFDMDMYRYDILIEKYQSLFGRKNVCVFSYEEMRNSMKRVLEDICEFFEVAYVPLPEKMYAKKVNESLPNGGLAILRFLNHFRKTELNPFPVFSIRAGLYANEGLHGKVAGLIKRVSPKAELLNDVLKSQIREYYRESNKRLPGIIGRDLTEYMTKLGE